MSQPPHVDRVVLAGTPWLALGVLMTAVVTLGTVHSAPSDVFPLVSSCRSVKAYWPREPPAGYTSTARLQTATGVWLGWRLTWCWDDGLRDVSGNSKELVGLGSMNMYEFRYGFPFACVCRWWTVQHVPGESPPIEIDHGTWVAELPLLGRAVVPVLPLWPGFALNTIFYALVAWGLWQIPGTIRRRSRRRAGKCARCGYDRAGIAAEAPCPECGATK